MAVDHRSLFLAVALLAAAKLQMAAEPVQQTMKFTGAPSCASTSCHGGGEGKNQSLTWFRKDFHSRANAILGTQRSARMAQALQIADATKSSRCTICHSPMQALPPERFTAGALPEQGVSCETCHGPAESWLLFHTRKDVTHAQRVAAGLRELEDFYGRANACVACHLNIDSELVRAGHPEMFFELDGQVVAQPPHWKDEGTWLGARAWLVGQAVALRELSWKLSQTQEPELIPRWQALSWLLARTGPSAQLPANGQFPAMQSAADRLARSAAREQWSREKVLKLLKDYAALSVDFRESPLPAQELRRRGEVLVLAIDRLWTALRVNTGATSEPLDAALQILAALSRGQAAFDPLRYSAALEQIEVALERGLPGW
jgi:hypothetical protein